MLILTAIALTAALATETYPPLETCAPLDYIVSTTRTEARESDLAYKSDQLVRQAFQESSAGDGWRVVETFRELVALRPDSELLQYMTELQIASFMAQTRTDAFQPTPAEVEAQYQRAFTLYPEHQLRRQSFEARIEAYKVALDATTEDPAYYAIAWAHLEAAAAAVEARALSRPEEKERSSLLRQDTTTVSGAMEQLARILRGRHAEIPGIPNVDARVHSVREHVNVALGRTP